MNILIIDDEPRISAVLSETLSSQGHQTSIFDSGKNGIDALKNGDYEILITDLGMPDTSGWEVINIAKQIEPGVITGVITGWDISEAEAEAQAEAQAEAKQKGVDFLITKPFESSQIVQVVANAIKLKTG